MSRPEDERRLRSSSLTVSPAHPPRFLRVCPAQPIKGGPALYILRPRKQSFLKRFTRRFPPRALPRWGPHKPSPDRKVARLHGQPRDPTPTPIRHVVYRPKPAHRASEAAFRATCPAKAGWLTNPDRPKASNSSQPSQQETKLYRNTATASQNPVDVGPVDLTWQPRQFRLKGHEVLASLFQKNQSTNMNSSSLSSTHEWHRCLASCSQIQKTSLKRTCFNQSIADDKLFFLDLCWSLNSMCLNLFVNSYNIRKCLDLLFALCAHIETTEGCYAMFLLNTPKLAHRITDGTETTSTPSQL